MKKGSTRQRDQIVSWLRCPSWVEPSLDEPGSIDPLGYQTEADHIAEELLPGVTVQTRRARYLSFLCWAMDLTGNNPAEIDRWEIALSLGEYLRHKGDTICSYLGILLLKQRNPDPRDRVPARLHQQTARALYSGLLRSCGLASEKGNLTPLGMKLAWEFGKKMPGTRPNAFTGAPTYPAYPRRASWRSGGCGAHCSKRPKRRGCAKPPSERWGSVVGRARWASPLDPFGLPAPAHSSRQQRTITPPARRGRPRTHFATSHLPLSLPL